MSAAQNAGRFCQCGCGRSLEGMQGTAKWARGCSDHRRQKQVSSEARRRERRLFQQETRSHASTNQMGRHCVSNYFDQATARTPVLHCKVCCGMSSARELTRRYKEGEGHYRTVAFEMCGRVVCRGCGDYYAPEKIEPASVLRSSAGTAANHGQLYGHQKG